MAVKLQLKYHVKYTRYEHKSGGIYQAVKTAIFKKEKTFQSGKKKWLAFRSDKRISWLKRPDEYPEDLRSWFTLEGDKRFVKESLPLITEWIPRSEIIKHETDDPGKIVYKDKYQVFVKENE